jgi:hypothetical protein
VRLAEAAHLKHLGQQVEYMPLAGRLALVDMARLTPAVTPAALPFVARLVVAGRELRDALDADTLDLRDALRGAAAASTAPTFTAAVQRVEKYLPLAESAVARVDALVAAVGALVAKIRAMEFISPSLVVPKPTRYLDSAMPTVGGAA